MNIVEVIKYAVKCHNDTNHLYDGMPYMVHLSMVVNVATRHIDAIPNEHQANVIAACWLHDVIEDTRQTYNDVKKVAGVDVAEIVYALTNEKGKNRKERANDKYYEGIRNTLWAVFVKLCDRIANVQYSKGEYSKSGDSRMFELYRKENKEFLEKLQPNRHYQPLVDELHELLNIGQNPDECDATKADKRS